MKTEIIYNYVLRDFIVYCYVCGTLVAAIHADCRYSAELSSAQFTSGKLRYE